MKLTVAQMVAMRRGGESIADIARAAGARTTSVTTLLRAAMGAEAEPASPWTPWHIAALREMAAITDPPVRWDDIAAALQMDSKAVQDYARKRGIRKKPCPRGVRAGAVYATVAKDRMVGIAKPKRAEAKLMGKVSFDSDPIAERAVHGRGRVHMPATHLPSRVEGHW